MKKIQYIRITSTMFMLIVFMLLLMGLMAIYSTTYASRDNSFLVKQLIWIVLGLIAGGAIALTPANIVSRYSKAVFVIVLIPLAYLAISTIGITILAKLTDIAPKTIAHYIPFAVYSKGAVRWLRIGGFTLQPAEFGKFAVILLLSTYYGMRDTIKIESLREGFLIPGLASAFLMLLVFLGRALSNTLITGATVLIIMYVAGVRLKYIVPVVALGSLLVIGSIMCTPYRRQRIINFIYKNKNEALATTGQKKADNHQLERAMCALGTGGLTGRGLGRGRLKNNGYIPESDTDFIYSVIGEDFGFAGIGAGISLYLLLMCAAFALSAQCKDRRGVLIAAAVGFLISFQGMYNLGVVCGLMPTTGVTAPLVSYGGSSIVSMLLCVGLLLNVCRENYQEALKENERQAY